jgi:uncharacterized protein (DUF1800 family)
MTLSIKLNPAAIAANRFGLGMRPEYDLPSNAKNWLHDQLSTFQTIPAPLSQQAHTEAVIKDFVERMDELRTSPNQSDKKDEKRAFKQDIRDALFQSVNARATSALVTNTPFVERLVHFWANHFAISIDKVTVIDFAGAFELDVIRPHVLGNFSEMLLAVEQHPAMLLYLDQVRSIGPNSLAASRMSLRAPDKKHGLNENLAREIMELHTLGVHGGYSQADVTEFARALTGWSIQGKNSDRNAQFGKNGFVFRPNLHEPGDRALLGRTYRQSGLAQGESILRDLASASATADHIAYKLARHFVSDDPPQSLVDKLARTFLKENGNLTSVYRVLIDASESWDTAPAKFKTPWEWLISSLRALSKNDLGNLNITQVMNQLGQTVWKPGSPAGFDDIAASWAAPDALLRRVELAQRLANSVADRLDARSLADRVLCNCLSAETRTAISRADSSATGLALLLVSPEFLRR